MTASLSYKGIHRNLMITRVFLLTITMVIVTNCMIQHVYEDVHKYSRIGNISCVLHRREELELGATTSINTFFAAGYSKFKNNYIEDRRAKRQSECKPKANLAGCNTKQDEANPKWHWRRFRTYKIKCTATRGCGPSSTLQYNWIIKDKITEKILLTFPALITVPIFKFNKYLLKTGVYTLELTVQENGVNGSGTKTLRCTVIIVSETPRPVISGGSSRTVPSDKDFKVDGSQSINFDIVPGNPAALKYKWSCKSTPPNEFCDTLIDNINHAIVIVPENHAINGHSFAVTLSVYANKDTGWIKSEQSINIQTGVIPIGISCVTNCENPGNFRLSQFLRVSCLENCEGITSNSFEWNMKPGKEGNKKQELDFEKETEYETRNTDKLIIKRNELMPEDIYIFEVTLSTAPTSKASYILKMVSEPAISKAVVEKTVKCTCVPEKGASLTTKFEINCSQLPLDKVLLVFQLFQVHVDSATNLKVGVLLITQSQSESVSQLKLNKIILSVGSKDKNFQAALHIIISLPERKHSRLFELTECVPRVTTTYNVNDVVARIRKIWSFYKKNVQKMIDQNILQNAIQVMSALASEAELLYEGFTSEAVTEFKEHFCVRLLQDITQFALEDYYIAKQVSTLVEKVIRVHRGESHSLFGRYASLIVREIALFQLERTTLNYEPYELNEEMAHDNNILLIAVTTNLPPNYKDLEQHTYMFNITTPFPLQDDAVITEYYPNYDDADEVLNPDYYKKLSDYEEGTVVGIESCIFLARGIANTMGPGEPFQYIIEKQDILIIWFKVDSPAGLATEHPQIDDADITFPSDFLNSNAPLQVFVIGFQFMPYWWASEAKEIATVAISIDIFKHQGDRVQYLVNPIEVLFTITNTNATVNAKNSSVSVPTDFNKWIPENIDYNMTIHRLDVYAGTGCLVEFLDIPLSDKLQVVVTRNRRPHTEDFQNPITISNENSFIYVSYSHTVATFIVSWFYIAVLPHKDMVKDASGEIFTYNYSVRFSSPSCVTWEASERQWKDTTCEIGQNTTTSGIHCLCKRFSTLAGLYEETYSKVDEVIEVSNETHGSYNYFIYGFVFGAVALYCIALMFVPGRSKKKPVYFLSDNQQNERYAYVVVVETGRFRDSGTTSNIGIKLYGQKSNTSVHILNYPDPDMRLLQKGNEDWFVLTSQYYLGNIEEIILWHDSVGYRPSWYCVSVTVYDMQKDDVWLFDVQRWFSVIEGEDTFVTVVKAGDPKYKKNWKHIFFTNYLRLIHTEHTWNIFTKSPIPYVTYIVKITILLSIVLTTYCWALIFLGSPKLHIYDVYDTYGANYEVDGRTLLIACVSSIISFMINWGFLLLFRFAFILGSRHEEKAELMHKIIWCALTTYIVTCITYLIVCGLWAPYITSLLWIIATILALLQTILLLENGVIIGRSIFFTIWRKATPKIDIKHVQNEVEKQRRKLFSRFGNISLRPYFQKNYQPLDRERWNEKKQAENIRIQYVQHITDLIMFMTYLALLFMVVLANRDSLEIYSHNNIRNILFGKMSKTMAWDDIKSISGFNEYINNTLIPCIHAVEWYDPFSMMDPGLTQDFATKVLGIARLRQVRTNPNSCRIPAPLNLLNLTCDPEYEYGNRDTGYYIEQWINNPAEEASVPRLSTAWKYNEDAESGPPDTDGVVTTYRGDGFTVPIGRTLYNAYFNQKYLENNLWVDVRTRAVFIELITYNAFHNIFNVVNLVVEFSATGYVAKSDSIFTSRLLFVKMEAQYMKIATFVAFIIVVLMIFYKCLFGLVKHWRSFVKDVWNVIDLLIVAMSFACIVLYSRRSTMTGQFLEQLETIRSNDFVEYFDVVYLEEVITVLGAFLIFIATVRLWRMMRFITIFRIMEQTLKLSGIPLLCLFTYHLVSLMMFAFVGELLFGSHSPDFKNLSSALRTLCLFTINLPSSKDHRMLRKLHGLLSYTYYTLFILVVMTVNVLYVAIIVLCFESSQVHFSNKLKSYSIPDFLHDELIYKRELAKMMGRHMRLRGGEDIHFQLTEQRKVTPKSIEHRYAKALSIPTYKLYVMSLISRCYFGRLIKKNKKKLVLADKDFDLMKSAVSHLLINLGMRDPKAVFFTSHAERKLVADSKLCNMERIVTKLLNESAANRTIEIPFADEIKTAPVKKDDLVLNRFDQINRTLDCINVIIDNIVLI